MSKFASKISPFVRTLFLVTLLLTFAGCGADVHWFPGNVRQPTDPDAFSFTTKTNVEPNKAITSDAITVAGLTAATSPISITGPTGSNSMFSINGATPTSSASTVKNGDTVTVTQTSSSSAGQSVTSTLTIGGVSGTFTTTTRAVNITFAAPTIVGQFSQAVGTLQVPGSGAHTLSIKDSANSGQALYSVGNDVSFTNIEATFTLGNGAQIFVRNLTSNVTANVTTTLAIDNIDFEVPLK